MAGKLEEHNAGVTPGWLWGLPGLGFALVILAVGALLWVLHRSDIEDQRNTLVSDLLWVEQDLRFNLVKLQDLLHDLGVDAVGGRLSAEQLENRIQFLKQGNPWLVRVGWYDGNGQVRMTFPPTPLQDAAPENFELIRAVGKVAFGIAQRTSDGDALLEIRIPYFKQGALQDVMVGTISLPKLLQQAIPWWYAEKYQLHIVDIGGDIVASRSKVALGANAESQSIAFDPPGKGLYLQATPYQRQTNLLRNSLAGAIVLLMLGVLWSLGVLRGHMKRRLKVETELREEYALRRAMEESVQTGLRARDLNGLITYVNPAFCRMVGWSAEELVGHGLPMPYWCDDEIESTRALNDAILAGHGPKQGFEIRFKRRNGEAFWALIHEAPLVDGLGQHTGWMSSVVDITPQKQAEERERQQQERLQSSARLITMGEMASSLAHELNQPLAAISSYATGSLNMIDAGRADLAELREVLSKTQAQAQRAGQIIRRIYDFVRRAEPKAEPCQPAILIGEIADLVEVDARRNQVQILREIAADLPTIKGDRVLLGQALLNLMKNGIEAMRGSPPAQRILTVRASADAESLCVSIIDRGTGIAAESAERLFEPFFTTKNEGMGMGLNICRSILEAHHGRIEVEANPEGGSIFTLTLPRRPT